MSVNTVQKYIFSLAEKGFISIEPTSVITKSGQKRNGTLRYTIRPIQNAVSCNISVFLRFWGGKRQLPFWLLRKASTSVSLNRPHCGWK